MLKKYKVSILVISLFAATVLFTVITYESKVGPTSTTKSSNVWVSDCEIPEQRPDSLTLTCADGGMRLEDLIWAVWDVNGAVGYGTYLENNCQPSCAEGTYSRTPVYVTLGEITEFNGRNFLNSLVITADQEGELPGGQPSISWDLPKPSEDDLLSE